MKHGKFTKQVSLSFIICLLSILLIGCDSTNTTSNDEEAEFVVSFGHGFMPETPHHQAALKFAEEVEEKSNDRISVEIFPSDQLGSAQDQFEGLQFGSQEIALLPTARISGFIPELQLLDLPFLFPDRETTYELLDGEVGQELLYLLEDQGVVGGAFYEDGFKHFTADHPLREVEDFAGVQFRTMESSILTEQFNALDANPVPVDFTELYNSLQQGVVDGQENPLVTIANTNLYEVQDYIMLSEHGYLGHVLMFGQDWLESLPDDLQEILLETGREMAEWQRQAVQEEEENYLVEMEDYGTEIIELTEEERDALREATLSAHEIYKDELGDELLNKVYEEVDY